MDKNKAAISIKDHFAFILTIMVTYAVGITLIIAQYFAAKNAQPCENENTSLIGIFMNSIIPTTITYVLGCVLVNIVEILQKKRDEYIRNIMACIFVMIYAMLFCVYLMTGFSWIWCLLELAATTGLLVLNVLCYAERCEPKSHTLV